MSPRIHTLLPPGGFHNLVGYHMAALDLALEELRAAARGASEDPRPVLREAGELEAAWIHHGVGGVPTPRAPAADEPPDAWLGWLDAVRTVTQMVLRPLADRDLERLVRRPGPGGETPRTLRRLLAELHFELGRRCGRLR